MPPDDVVAEFEESLEREARAYEDALAESVAERLGLTGRTRAFDPDQPRDEDGKWAGGSSSGSSDDKRQDEVSLKGTTFEDVDLSKLDKAHPRVRDEVKRVLKKVSELLPREFSGMLNSIELSKHMDDSVYAVESPNSILLNERLFGEGANLDKVLKELKEEYETGYASADGLEHLITHELAHVVSSIPKRTAISRGNDFVSQYPANEGELSKYGMTSYKEAIAEAFSAYVSNPDGGSAWMKVYGRALRGEKWRDEAKKLPRRRRKPWI